jgi:hypothetical protein
MTDRPERIEFLLLDMHLQQLEPEEASRVQEALTAFSDLAGKNERLCEVLSLLERCEAPPVRPGLAEAVLARVEAQTAIYPFDKPAPVSHAHAVSAHEMSSSPVLSLREIIAIAACITLFVGIFVPGYFKAQSIAVRNRCLDNLRQVWGATSEYAAGNNGQLAYMGYNPGASWLPTKASNIRRFSNTAQMYALVKGGFVRDTLVFICPASPNARPMRPEGDNYAAFDDFAEPANTSYSYLFNNTPKPIRLSEMNGGPDTRIGLAGDHNPFFDAKSAGTMNPYDEASGNSPTHDNGAGQNVVFVSGWAGWFRQPTVGVDNDNVYRAGKLGRYLGTESPVCSTDTLLVP